MRSFWARAVWLPGTLRARPCLSLTEGSLESTLDVLRPLTAVELPAPAAASELEVGPQARSGSSHSAHQLWRNCRCTDQGQVGIPSGPCASPHTFSLPKKRAPTSPPGLHAPGSPAARPPSPKGLRSESRSLSTRRLRSATESPGASFSGRSYEPKTATQADLKQDPLPERL